MFVILSIAKRFKMIMIASGNHTIAYVLWAESKDLRINNTATHTFGAKIPRLVSLARDDRSGGLFGLVLLVQQVQLPPE